MCVIPDGVGTKRYAHLCASLHTYKYAHVCAFVYEYVTEAELGCFHKITVGRRRGGTTGMVVEGNK